jgi:hypothetical protein
LEQWVIPLSGGATLTLNADQSGTWSYANLEGDTATTSTSSGNFFMTINTTPPVSDDPWGNLNKAIADELEDSSP